METSLQPRAITKSEGAFFSADACPFLFKRLQKKWQMHLNLREGEASTNLMAFAAIPVSAFVSDSAVIWIPAARDWLAVEPEVLVQQVQSLLKKHQQLMIVLPWTAQVAEYGPWNWLSKESTTSRLRALNDRLCENPVFSDRLIRVEPLLMQMGLENAYDPRFELSNQMPWTLEFQERLADLIYSFWTLRQKGTKKVLAVDFDRTLWPGILAEDEVRLEPGTLTGDAFRSFQKKLIELRDRGIFLVGLSRNDSQLVQEKWNQIPGMLLKKEDFSLIYANWNKKSLNLLEAARELNLAVDSFCFVDDDAAEIHRMRQDLPEVECLHLDSDPAMRTQQLQSRDWFWSFHLTNEDQRRARNWKPAFERELEIQEKADDLLDLHVEVKLSLAKPEDLLRLHQLVTKTNQFNFTNERWSIAEIEERLNDPGSEVWIYRVSDRFDDLGLVGALFLKKTTGGFKIENWLMSCRAFSRQVEEKVWELMSARANNWTATWNSSGRNDLVKTRLENWGFAQNRQDPTIWTRSS